MDNNELISATESENNETTQAPAPPPPPENAAEAREQADTAKAAATEASTAAEDAQEKFDADKPALDAAVTTAEGEVEDAKENLEEATEAREAAKEARDEAFDDAEEAKEAAKVAQDELNDAVVKANELIEEANEAAAALVKAIEERNDLQIAVNEAIDAVIVATESGDTSVDISALRDAATAAQALLSAFDTNTNLDALESLRASTDKEAQDAIDEVDVAQKAFDDAMDAVQDAIDLLNAAELEYFKSQEAELAATIKVNEAIDALNEALEALHDAGQELDEALAFAEHMQEVAGIKEANALAWEKYEADMAEYETDHAAWETDHAAWKLLNDAWEAGLDADDPEFIRLYNEWRDAMAEHEMDWEEYEALKEAFEAAQRAHDAAMAGFNARKAAHEEALREWEEYQEGIKDGTIQPYSADIIGQGSNIPNNLNGNSSMTIAPGIVLSRNAQGVFTLSVSEGASQGTFTIGERADGHRGPIWEITVSGVGDHTITFGPQSDLAGFGVIGTFKSFDKPTFGENPPGFDEEPPTPPD